MISKPWIKVRFERSLNEKDYKKHSIDGYESFCAAIDSVFSILFAQSMPKYGFLMGVVNI